MATSIKLNSPYYWDSSNVVYNRTPLNTTLNNINTSLNNINTSLTGLNTKANNCKDYLKIYKSNSSEPLDWPGAIGQWTVFGSMTTWQQYGSRLTRDGYWIKIGAGVEKIRIRAQVLCQIDAWSANDWLMLGIGKNGTTTNIGTIVAKTIISELAWINLQCEAIVDVVEGDYFGMYVRNEVNKSFKFYNYSSGFGNTPSCSLEVEVIKYSDNL